MESPDSPDYAQYPPTDLVLVNPAAGGGQAQAVLPHLREFAKRRAWNAVFCVTESPQDLATKARSAAQSGCPRIFVLGGDGTFHVVVNATAQYPEIILSIIPAGGGNDLAAALGLPSDPIQAAAVLLDGETAFLDAVQVRTADGNERLYTGGGGVGLDTEAVRYANSSYRNIRGRTRYILGALRAWFTFRPMFVRITNNSSEFESASAAVLLVGVLNTPSYGGGLYLATHARIDDGELDVVVLENLGVMDIFRILPGLVFRGELRTNRIRRFAVACARIETDPPYWFHGDGELLGITPVEIAVLPKAIRVLRASRPQKR